MSIALAVAQFVTYICSISNSHSFPKLPFRELVLPLFFTVGISIDKNMDARSTYVTRKPRFSWKKSVSCCNVLSCPMYRSYISSLYRSHMERSMALGCRLEIMGRLPHISVVAKLSVFRLLLADNGSFIWTSSIASTFLMSREFAGMTYPKVLLSVWHLPSSEHTITKTRAVICDKVSVAVGENEEYSLQRRIMQM